jgi:hypothetical protein
MRIFKNKAFHRWAKEQGLSNTALTKAIQEMEHGLYEANLGGSVYKKRVASGSRGKSSGARTIIAFQWHEKAFFIYGFAKNARENINLKEEHALKSLAKIYFGYDATQIEQAIKIGELIEVTT